MNLFEPSGTTTTDAWLRELRSNLLAVARRRVLADAAEDVVQETMRILLEKGGLAPGWTSPEGAPALAVALRILRNVIGNHYQRDRMRRPGGDLEDVARTTADPAPTPLEALATEERVRIVRESLAAMATRDRDCARYLQRLLDGVAPGALARQEGLEEAVLYRRVYRCRLKLRTLLERRGIAA